MTTRSSFSEGCTASPNKRFFNSRFFRFKLKTGWPLFVVFIFVFVLSLAVPTVNFVTDTAVRYDTITYKKMMIESAVKFLYTIGAINVVVSMLMGFAAGICTINYVNKKTGVNFYHSLPIRREALFLTNALRGFVYYIVSFGTGLLLVFFALWMRLGSPLEYVRPILLTLEYGVLFFFLIYSIALFAASLTGTGFMRFITALYVIFLPLVLAVLFVYAVYVCGPNTVILDPDYYVSLNVLSVLMSPLRFFNLCVSDGNNSFVFSDAMNGDIIVVLITAAVLFGVAFLLYCLRQSESASKPVIWRPAAFVFKYATMFCSATIFAMIFSAIFDSILWTAFGIIFGAVITFMLTNGILHKSARAIFRGIKGFVIFLVVMAGITAVFYMDSFGIFGKIPDGSFVSRIELELGGDLSCDYSGDVAEKITNMLGEMKINGDYDELKYTHSFSAYAGSVVYDDVSLYGGYGYDTVWVNAVLHTEIGIPYAVQFYTSCEDVAELSRFIYAKEDNEMTVPDPKDVVGTSVDIFIGVDSQGGWSYSDSVDDEKLLVEMVGQLKDPFLIKADSPVVGSIYLAERNHSVSDTYGGYSYMVWDKTYYITAADYEVLNELNKEKPFTSEDDVIRYFADKCEDEIVITNNATGETLTVTDPDEKIEIMEGIYSYSFYSYDPLMCRKDHDYCVAVRVRTGDNDYEYVTDVVSLMTLRFRKGAVPDFVSEYFAK